MYERILVPTDGSDVAEVAIDHAVELAERYGAELHAIYVVDTDSVSLTLGAEQVDRIEAGHFGEMDELEAQARSATQTIRDRAGERDIPVHEEFRAGRPHDKVADYADEIDADLIVMGSHGRGGVRRALLGSVTERVLRSTDRPVMVVDARREE